MSQQPPPPSAATPPPGWYFDGREQRWWDGVTWGPRAPDSSDRTLATLSHLGVVLGGFVLPLVMYLISDDERRPETRYHAREALNFQISFMVAYIAGFVLMFGGFAVSGLFSAAGGAEAAGAGIGLGVAGFFAFFALILAVIIANFVFSITGAVRANRGDRYRYPVSFRFVKG